MKTIIEDEHRAALIERLERLRPDTPPTGLEQDRRRLFEVMEAFAESASGSMRHPVFGRLSRKEWGIWGYRHVDHHARQFGL